MNNLLKTVISVKTYGGTGQLAVFNFILTPKQIIVFAYLDPEKS